MSAKPHKLHPPAAFGLGMVAGIAYIGWSVGLKRFAFDDVVDTVTGKWDFFKKWIAAQFSYFESIAHRKKAFLCLLKALIRTGHQVS